MKSHDTLWEEAFPDSDERAQWHAHFGRKIHDAKAASAHFTDPARAARWADFDHGYSLAGQLDRLGITPDDPRIDHALTRAEREEFTAGRDPFGDGVAIGHTHTRASLLLTHPHLTSEDREAIVTAGLTADEVHHLITTDTYDRAALAVMAGLARS